MEGGNSSDRDREKPPEGDGGVGGGEPKVKRKMKTPSQLEVLERTYQVETYPSESLRAELSAQLGLTDRQLQMWFCHRRLKDRKLTTSSAPSSSSKRSKKVEGSPATSTPPVPPPSSSAAFAANEEDGCGVDLANDHGSGSGSGSSPYRHLDIRRGGVPRTGVAVPRISHGRYYEPPQQPIAELRAIAHIEAQLGEPLREDGPALGIEFESLPPGAFGAPIGASGPQHKQAGRVYEHNLYERPDVKPIKGHGRALHEYQFLPEQPNVRGDSYERLAPSHYYGSSSDGPTSRAAAVTGGRASYMYGGEDILGYGYQGQGPSLSLMSQPGKHNHLLPLAKDESDGIPRKAPYTSMSLESPYSAHPITGLDGGSERRTIHDDEVLRVDRKRKSEEARLQKEVEAHEKRMRKELEKQDMLRRKREEQMKKEMERHDRERRKEEERMLREKQREEERYQREQKREMERREKLLIKESIKAEKLKQKEELRREREAARQKAASDRAAARRIAKESMELIEDDRLELMEIAALKKGLPSILSLDSETLQCLDSFRDMLRVFPPKTVQLKRPFSVQPWIDSEENVGNLLMLWRFLITFADVLGLWPFTLDEIVQAFHDYDPRILGEIHIALLKTIIKDIEDVARTPSSGLGANQYSAANPSGGHPHIVEGAYAWGFDIRSWQCHLGPLTWPEILRQFALSAGFGPKLKKRNIEPAYMRDDHEGNDGKDIISNLRTGAAVENAVAIMQERGYSNTRKSRHRLTPGTVKFAAFHVLSLEGSNGLNILEVADRIQKSGLRDLTTSKTPEASIAAALSRDTKLFERVAPSTYCVRTPYRKDSADAEAILSAAREKIRIFKSGFVDGVEAEDVEKEDDVEKDDDSESDTAEDPEVDDLTADIAQNKDSEPFYDINRPTEEAYASTGLETVESNMASNCARNGLVNGGSEDIPIMGSGQGRGELNDPDSVSVDQSANGAPVEIVGITNQEDNDIDESYPGEPWVQGLMESDYTSLSVEERLGALVALIGVAVEGNSIRLVLEERLEAANALKKQMWAEAQLDKRRLKEEHIMKPQYSTFAGNTVDAGVANSATAENRQSPLINHEDKRNEAHMEIDAQNEQKSNPEMLLEKNSANTEFNFGQDNMSAQQSIYAAAERSRAQMKSYIGYKAEELYVYRSLPLGMDRRRNRYWQFVASASSNDPGSGRIFVELHSGSWRLIDSEEAFDALMASLDVRGVRESHLHALLQRIEVLFKETVKKQQATVTVKPKEESGKAIIFSGGASNPESGEDSPNSSICGSSSDASEISSSFQIECGQSRVELKGILRRYKEFEDWMWKECYMSSILRAHKHGKKRDTQLLGVCSSCHYLYFCEDNHCQSCHKTFSGSEKNFDFSDHSGRCDEMFKSNPVWARNDLDSLAPLRIRLFKAQLALVEASLPAEALQPFWSNGFRKSWATRLHVQSSVDDLLQLLTVLEGAINKDFISSNFCKTADFLGSNNVSKFVIADALNLGAINVLPWIPQTTAAVALRLMELDSALSYTLQQELESRKDVESGDLEKPASKFTIVRSNKGIEPTGVDHAECPREDIWNDPASASFSYGRSKGGRGKGVRSRPSGAAATGSGGRSQRRVSSGSRTTEPSRKSLVAAPSGGKLGPVLGGWKNRSARGRGGKKRSRRSTRSRQKPVKKEIAGPPSSGGRSTNEFQRSAVFDQTSHEMSVRGEEEEWTGDEEEELPQMHEEMEAGGDGNGSNSERSVEEYDEDDNDNENENGQGTYVDDEYEDIEIDGGPYERAYRGKAPEDSEDNVDDEDEEEEDDDDEDMADAGGANEYEQRRGGYTGNDEIYEQREDGDEYEQDVDVDVGGYLNADSDEEDNNDDGRYGIMGRQGPSNNWNRGRDSGSGSGSGSTDYSD